MPVDSTSLGFIYNINIVFWIKIFLILFIIFYCVFSFMLIKQIQMVTKELPTPIMPFLKFISIVNFGISLALIFLVMGLF